MSSRRQVFTELKPGPTTHAGLWLDKGLADVSAEGGHRQAHFEGLTQSIKIPGTYRAFFARWREQVAQVPPCTILAEARVKGRMIVGLGAESILETGITLNHTYGVPYLPGSSLKGLAASFAHKMLAAEDWRKGTGASHRVLFGDQESSGYVTFHDALWIPESADRLPFDLDVMTVHYPKYYQGEPIAPSGIESPNPVAFLTTRGRFLLAVSGPETWATAALDILQEALLEEGLGAKTAAGYGRMDLPERPSKDSTSGGSSTPAAGLWQPAQILYDPGRGELTAVLTDQKKATALQKETRELLEKLDPEFRAALLRRRKANAEVRVGLEGISLRIIGLRPAGSGP